MQKDCARVLETSRVVLSLGAHEACDPFRKAKKRYGLIYKVCTKVVDHTGSWAWSPFPTGATDLGPVSVEMCLKFHHSPQRAFLQELQDGKEIRVISSILESLAAFPPAIPAMLTLIYRQQTVVLCSYRNELLCFMIRRHEWLLHDHCSLQCCLPLLAL